ncbi:MAG: sugar ABC transporter substrate-binding protein [Lautropia sp.]|nr:sugar ABC transporter substrate-binding protein [Lautropia sp.]
MTMKKLATALLSSTLLIPALAHAEQTTINYWMWDAPQLPVYQKCAAAFQKENPDIKINITQSAWDQYWTSLQTALISGDAPDVFVNHVTRLPEMSANDIIQDLKPLIEQDEYDTAGYQKGLLESWVKEGAIYGLPKDWATVAVAYDREQLEAAGLKPEDMANLSWNPEDGGSFGKVIERLTVDVKGKRGNEEGFDPNNIKIFGFVTNNLSAHGETEWSFLAASTGWKFIDEPWATEYHYDDPRLVSTLNWLRDLARVKHHMPTAEQSGQLGAETLMFSGKGAMTVTGSWLIDLYHSSKPSVVFAPLPAGPEGRKSMFNGLADSIWTGSDNQEAAWKWVKFLGSDTCQSIVADAAIVFPARSSQLEATMAAYKKKGIDVSAFTEVAKPESSFPFPITDHGNEISAIAKAALDRVMRGQSDTAELMKKANTEINDLF